MGRKRSKASAREHLVVVGGGMAGLRLIEEVVATAPGRFQITMVAKERQPAYNRVLLSGLVSGDVQPGDVELRPQSWYAESGIALLSCDAAVAIDCGQREIELASGARLLYDRLVLATGSKAKRLPVVGAKLPGVTTFRDLADAHVLRSAEAGLSAVVIGGGLLGIEAAYGLARRGLKVTLLHLMPRLMERQLDGTAAALLKASIESLGVEVVLQAQTAAIQGGAKAEMVLLADGRSVPAGLVVIAAGVEPETALARQAGLEVGRGIVVDDGLQTSEPAIFAIGECAEHCGQCYGLVEPAYEQAKVLARGLAGEHARYAGSLLATSLKVSGVPVFSIGDFEGAGAESLVFEDESAGVYRKLVVRDDRLCGAVLVGDTSDALWYRELVRDRAHIAPVRAVLAFGKAYAEAA